ncbi:MAG TPA: hypothetical protein VFK05_11180 [Polyangiaceae bacterium]|nr:hypothetical protein [Polyangiaceae bacterium]
MSFEDDAVEPLAVESAAHFMELLRRAGTQAGTERDREHPTRERREWIEPRRALPRELGN